MTQVQGVRCSYLAQQFSDCEDLWQKLREFVKTGDFTLGEELKKFEKSFAELIGTKYAVGVNSSTDAIKLSLKALGVVRGDEVITAANTFVATAGHINEFMKQDEIIFISEIINNFFEANLILNNQDVDFVS